MREDEISQKANDALDRCIELLNLKGLTLSIRPTMRMRDYGGLANASAKSNTEITFSKELIEVLEHNEVIAFIAHELGHIYYKDVDGMRQKIISVIGVPGMMASIYYISTYVQSFFASILSAYIWKTLSTPIALCLTTYLFPINFIISLIIIDCLILDPFLRKYAEIRADIFSKYITDRGEDLGKALHKTDSTCATKKYVSSNPALLSINIAEFIGGYLKLLLPGAHPVTMDRMKYLGSKPYKCSLVTQLYLKAIKSFEPTLSRQIDFNPPSKAHYPEGYQSYLMDQGL